MNKELIDLLIKDKDSLTASFTIANTVDVACDKLLVKLKTIVEEDIANELGLIGEFAIDWKKRNSYFCFYKEDWKLASISFQFQYYDKDMIYGIARENECLNIKDPYGIEIFEKLAPMGGELSTWWPFYKSVEQPFDYWGNIEPWTAIVDESVKPWIKNKVIEILNLLDGKDL